MNSDRPTIALIDDEPQVRVPLAAALSDAGYTVLSAASGVEGLALLAQEDVDLALIDVVLPGRMDGVALAKEAKRQKPGLRVIFTSGHPLRADLQGLGEFVAKPSRVATLLEIVARHLPKPR